MKPVPSSLLSLTGAQLLVFIVISVFSVQLSSGVSVISSSHQHHHGGTETEDYGHSSSLKNITAFHHHRVKRQLVAYHRLEAGGILPVLDNRRRGHGGKGGRRSAVGEDGTDERLFRSAGVGYEHKHNNRCEESKCGYNIRHCPHGCVFNSFQCGNGAAYDTCCC